MVSGGVANHDLDLTVEPNNSPKLCNNAVNRDCCSCFKSAYGGTETLARTCSDVLPIQPHGHILLLFLFVAFILT